MLADAGLAVGQAQEMGPSHFGESTEHGFGIHPSAAHKIEPGLALIAIGQA
jgi:hypothetical protein